MVKIGVPLTNGATAYLECDDDHLASRITAALAGDELRIGDDAIEPFGRVVIASVASTRIGRALLVVTVDGCPVARTQTRGRAVSVALHALLDDTMATPPGALRLRAVVIVRDGIAVCVPESIRLSSGAVRAVERAGAVLWDAPTVLCEGAPPRLTALTAHAREQIDDIATRVDPDGAYVRSSASTDPELRGWVAVAPADAARTERVFAVASRQAVSLRDESGLARLVTATDGLPIAVASHAAGAIAAAALELLGT